MTKKRILVFMDEVNCLIQGHSAMGLLLSPIWDGSFIRDGRMFRLLPAVWVFASPESVDDLVGSNKGSDFVSRLNGPIIELDRLSTAHGEILSNHLKKLRKKLGSDPNWKPEGDDDYKTFLNMQGAFRTDQTYLGISLLNNLWGPVSKVQEEVLQLFHDILLINGFRSLEFYVSKFQNIERGIVVSSNVPSVDKYPELKRHVVLPPKWRNSSQIPKDQRDPDRLIEIEVDAAPV